MPNSNFSVQQFNNGMTPLPSALNSNSNGLFFVADANNDQLSAL